MPDGWLLKLHENYPSTHESVFWVPSERFQRCWQLPIVFNISHLYFHELFFVDKPRRSNELEKCCGVPGKRSLSFFSYSVSGFAKTTAFQINMLHQIYFAFGMHPTVLRKYILLICYRYSRDLSHGKTVTRVDMKWSLLSVTNTSGQIPKQSYTTRKRSTAQV